ncbi:MAG: phosphotransferase, partial [Ilumatobacteraceae bacterium]
LKVVPPPMAAALADRHRLVHDLLTGAHSLRATAISSPRVVAVDSDLGIVELGAMVGTPLHDTLLSGDAPSRRAALRAAAGVLVDLASIEIADTALHGMEAGDGGTPAQWMTIAGSIHSGLLSLHAPVVSLLGAAARRLSDVRHSGVSLVHGDLHDKNLLLSDGHAAVIDLDAAGGGDPAVDQGNLVAHVALRALQRGDGHDVGRAEATYLLDAIGRLADTSADDDHLSAVRLHAARALHRLSVIYRCRHRWAHLSSSLLDESWHWAVGLAATLQLDHAPTA